MPLQIQVPVLPTSAPLPLSGLKLPLMDLGSEATPSTNLRLMGGTY